MATDQDKNHFLLGECKFKNTRFDLAEMNAALMKFKPNKKNAQVHYYLFSKSGFTRDVENIARQQDICLVGIDELFVFEKTGRAK